MIVWAALFAASLAPAQSDPAAVAEQAHRAMAEQRFAEAADLYQALTRSFPGQPLLQANLGMALHLSAQDSKAVEPLRIATNGAPDSFPAHFFLGASLTRLGRHGEAIEPLRTAAVLDPAHSFTRALLGDALEATGGFAEAVVTWKSLLGLESQNPYAHAGLVRCYEQLAADAVTRLTEHDPESPYVLRLLARSRMDTAQYTSSLYLYRQALERAPGVRAMHEAVAEIYERTDRSDWAAAEREKMAVLPTPDCRQDSDSPECRFAARRYDELVPSDPQASVPELFWAARAYGELAKSSFASLTALPETVDQLTLLADILAAQEQYSRAAEACQRALAIREGDPQLQRQLAELLYLGRNLPEAKPFLERFVKEDPKDPRWLAMLGNILAGEQDYEAAVRHLEAAAGLPGSPATVALDLGRSYVALGRNTEAVDQLESVRGMDSDGSVHYQLAQAYQRLGRREEARSALQRYRELDSQRRSELEASASLEITPPD